MTEPKYRIRRMLLQKPGSLTQNKYQLCIALGINVKTLDNWMRTQQGDKFSIPSDAFYSLAEYFKCNPLDLLTKAPVIHG